MTRAETCYLCGHWGPLRPALRDPERLACEERAYCFARWLARKGISDV